MPLGEKFSGASVSCFDIGANGATVGQAAEDTFRFVSEGAGTWFNGEAPEFHIKRRFAFAKGAGSTGSVWRVGAPHGALLALLEPVGVKRVVSVLVVDL